MAKVKGSKQDYLVLKPHRPVRKVVLGVFGFLFFVGVLVLCFGLGQQYERDLQILAPGQRAQLESLREKVVTLERDRLVDQVAIENARGSLKTLEVQVAQQNKAIAFYRSIMAPESIEKGLHVQRLDVEKLGEAGKYRLDWVVSQVGKNDKYVQGKTSLQLTGISAGERRVLSLKELADDIPSLAFKLRYFQSFSVEVVVPDDIEIKAIEVFAESSMPGAQDISREFEWVNQETIADVGQ